MPRLGLLVGPKCPFELKCTKNFKFSDQKNYIELLHSI